MKRALSVNVLASARVLKSLRQLFCLVVYVAALQFAAQAQSANILITPATSNITIGGSFTINVRVDMQSGSCNAAEVHLNFNTAYLRITNIGRPSSGTFTSETIPLPAAPYTTVNSTGHLEYAAGIPSGSTSADFDILAITFSTPPTSPQSGTTSITLQNTPGHRTRTALNGTPLTGTLTGGTVNITCTPPSATIAAASTCGGQAVPVNLNAASGASPFSLVVNGSTYNGVTVSSTPFASIPFPNYSIWPSNPTPSNPATQDDGPAIHVGTKFKSSQTGFVKSIRFYAGNNVTGTFKGKLWKYDPPSALLQSVTFTSVNADGWNEVQFSTPVAIAANATYVVTMYSSEGKYVADENYFTSPVTSGPLTAVGSTSPTADMNGIYYLGTEAAAEATMSAGGFGDWSSFARSNYWVDLVFVPNSNVITLTSVTDANGCNVTGSLQTINVFSPDCSTLPVTLTNLSATPGGRKVTLRWSTSSEINNKGFDVMRSTDGVNWITLGFVTGAGNSVSAKSYTYLDENLDAGKYYYKLKQIDIDNRFKFSVIVSATIGSKAEYVLGQNYPNPFSNVTTIQYSLPKSGQVRLSLFDINGREVKVLVNGSKDAGTHAINLYTGSLSKGMYYYKMQVDDFSDVKKLVIQ